MTKRKWIFVIAPIGMAIFTAIGGEVVLLLWNWLLPRLFGFPQITFWQAIGLLALCRILFGGLRLGGSARSHAFQRAKGGWEKLTPEEREKWRQLLHDRWTKDAPSDPKTSA